MIVGSSRAICAVDVDGGCKGVGSSSAGGGGSRGVLVGIPERVGLLWI